MMDAGGGFAGLALSALLAADAAAGTQIQQMVSNKYYILFAMSLKRDMHDHRIFATDYKIGQKHIKITSGGDCRVDF